MNETPLRTYLTDLSISAEDFASQHGLSPWSVRHWSRGDKEPNRNSQLEIERATGGKVTPAHWLEWNLSQMRDTSTPTSPATDDAALKANAPEAERVA